MLDKIVEYRLKNCQYSKSYLDFKEERKIKKEAQTAAQRKKLERDIKRNNGLVPVEIWVYPEQKAMIKNIENKCQEDNKYLRD